MRAFNAAVQSFGVEVACSLYVESGLSWAGIDKQHEVFGPRQSGELRLADSPDVVEVPIDCSPGGPLLVNVNTADERRTPCNLLKDRTSTFHFFDGEGGQDAGDRLPLQSFGV